MSGPARCSKTMYGDAGFGGRKCSHEGILKHEGNVYCKQHYPPNVKARIAANQAKWQAEWDTKCQRTSDREAHQAAAEQVCGWVYSQMSDQLAGYPDVLALLETWKRTGGD